MKTHGYTGWANTTILKQTGNTCNTLCCALSLRILYDLLACAFLLLCPKINIQQTSFARGQSAEQSNCMYFVKCFVRCLANFLWIEWGNPISTPRVTYRSVGKLWFESTLFRRYLISSVIHDIRTGQISNI